MRPRAEHRLRHLSPEYWVIRILADARFSQFTHGLGWLKATNVAGQLEPVVRIIRGSSFTKYRRPANFQKVETIRQRLINHVKYLLQFCAREC